MAMAYRPAGVLQAEMRVFVFVMFLFSFVLERSRSS